MRDWHSRAIKLHVLTVIVPALEAIAAVITGSRRRDSNKITCFKSEFITSRVSYNTGHFMTENHRFFQGNRPKTTVVVVMQIRTTHATD